MLTAEDRRIIEEVNFCEPSLLLDRFKYLIRQSGSEDERIASQYIAGKLKEFGIEYDLLWPEIFLSTPMKAELKIIGHCMDIKAKTPSFSMSTGERWVDGELIFASSYRPPYASDGFEYRLRFDGNPKGKIVICDGIPSPDKVNDIISNGGLAAIFIQEGSYIHESICTDVWGNPGLDDSDKVLRIPVVTINNPDGLKLVSMVKEGRVRAAVRTTLDEGWKKCPLLLAKINGYREPEKFLLLHGHIDSWHTGIGDNALGDAALLEIARVLQNSRGSLKRSVWIAWWPGHSTGRYAGSAWFADHYAMDIYDNCIAQVNCESVGCIDANTYEGITWTEDVDKFCRELVKEVTSIEPEWTRPIRAGDYSFNNIGVSSLFMVSSSIGRRRKEELGYYEVYGCGGNIEWHTANDDMAIVDKEIFIRDTRLYAAAVLGMANADILPIDCRDMLGSMERYLNEYKDVSGEIFDFKPLFNQISSLKDVLDNLYSIAGEYSASEEVLSKVCDAILKVERRLIRINYTSKGEFMHDPAAMVPPIPDIAPVLTVHQLDANSQKLLATQLVRGRNKVLYALKECMNIINGVLLIINSNCV